MWAECLDIGEACAPVVGHCKSSTLRLLNCVSTLLTASRLLPKGLYLDKTIANARTELAWETDYIREAEDGFNSPIRVLFTQMKYNRRQGRLFTRTGEEFPESVLVEIPVGLFIAG